jgi:hypothetical protein
VLILGPWQLYEGQKAGYNSKMLYVIKRKQTILTSWVLSVFIILLVVGGFISEFFQAPTENLHELDHYRYLFKKKNLLSINSVEIQNRIGEFKLIKSTGTSVEQDSWHLVEPRNLPAQKNEIFKIIDGLRKIKIRKIYEKDPINLSNFSLESPIFTIKIGPEKTREQVINFGLVNPIDRSTYLTLSGSDAIYHIDALEVNLEAIDLAGLIDSNIFHHTKKEIQSVSIWRGDISSSSKARLYFQKEKDNWINHSKVSLNSKRVDEYMNALRDLHALFIIDESTQKQDKLLKKVLEKPYMNMNITKSSGEVVNYKISTLINHFPDLKTDQKQVFVILASNGKYPYILPKDKFQIFTTKTKKLKGPSFKKLFY